MPAAKDYKLDTRIFALFVGRSGDGKSAAEASFPKPLQVLDYDFRFAGIAGAINQGWLSGDEIYYEQFNPRGGWAPVDAKLSQLELDRVAGNFKYKTLTTDSLTSLTRLFVNASHTLQNGRTLGKLRISGPADFNFEQTATHQYFDFLRTFPCNILCSAHIIDKWGKDPAKDTKDGANFSQNIVLGEKLSIRDNLGENVQTYFDNVFRFSRELIDGVLHYFVEFATDLAKNSYGIPPGKFDITNKEFYPFLIDLIHKIKSGFDLKTLGLIYDPNKFSNSPLGL